MIEKLIERFFEAASMQRWNDHIRPVELTELDKQAHKMVIAYVIAKIEEDRKGKGHVNWLNLIESFIFEFLYRLVLTDIKPPVFHRMMAERRQELNNHVLTELKEDFNYLNDEKFKHKFESYFMQDENTLERRILRAAHYLATNWEFKIIYHSAPFIYGIEKTKENIENQIEDHYDLIGVQKILLGKKSYGFVDLCGQLRFQKRWAHSPRVPETSVLGHMLIVAITAYLCTIKMESDPCERRVYNNFFAGLFHDLPEVSTRDIISPIKSAAGLEDIIKDYENERMKEEVLPLLPKTWHDEMKYFTEDEFENKIKKEGVPQKGIKFKEMNKKYNINEYSPLDGELIRACDKLAAFIETNLSIEYGITSRYLEEGRENIFGVYKNKVISGTDFGRIFNYFYKKKW
ncbi:MULTISPECIES: HD domain-containing protein [Methanobacterium]|jgi:putative hydrolase of HD superfamily|uniref:HD domain-containing protein n=1 Tax=Methanobacterium veterum TaxID=408577 RepID=A0A9E4ZU87_9EURY|nr:MULTISPECIES: HD domain-containing protein [Methanobacterium]MCZ3365737.1 HD domain-containing protein [Methanobacterium veterum]MCZ3371201.1 HD domain-containing protein [Methanobacterium veterum]